MMYKFEQFINEINGENPIYKDGTIYFENMKYGVPVKADNLENALKEIEQWQIFLIKGKLL